MSATLVLQHGPLGPPCLLDDWAGARGIPLDIHRMDEGSPTPALDERPALVSLGSHHSPTDADEPEVAAEAKLMDEALRRDIPVLGLCFGGQMLALALGATVERAPAPELGWHRVKSVAPDVIAHGPWLQWHFDRFTLPPGSELLATSDAGVQAFRRGRDLGVQFHPESTIEVVRAWAVVDEDRLAALGISHGPSLVERGRRHAAMARQAAFTLFDAFWRGVHR